MANPPEPARVTVQVTGTQIRHHARKAQSHLADALAEENIPPSARAKIQDALREIHQVLDTANPNRQRR